MAGFMGLFIPSVSDWTGLSTDELATWTSRAGELDELWAWYDGTRLRDEDAKLPFDQQTGRRPLKYPLQINLVAPAARAHSFTLWGEVEDTSEPPVRAIVEAPFDEVKVASPRAGADPNDPGFPALPGTPAGAGSISPSGAALAEAVPPVRLLPSSNGNGRHPAPRAADRAGARAIAKQAERVLSNIFYENNMRSMLVDTGLSIQILAGMAFKVGWAGDKDPMLPTGIRLEYIDPRYFHPRWRGNDYWNLTEAWIKLTISAESAKADFGVSVSGKTALYVEYWNRDVMWIKIDGQFATMDGVKMDVKHGWGFVPIFYIPHERRNSFWGISMASDMIGLTREINARMADMGDAVRMAVRRIITAKNLKGGHPVKKELAGGTVYFDLGRAISQGDPQPDMSAIDSPQLPAATDKFQAMLLEMGRTQMLTPSIVYGEEEGSQRSGQTLYQRMWPLLAHTRQERAHWTTGLNLMCEMALRILAIKNRAGVGPQHIGLRKRQRFAPMVPVDREKVVDEVIRRLQEHAISPEHALETFGDVSDIDDEMQKIEAYMRLLAELQLLSKPAPAEQGPVINKAEHK